MGKKSKKKKKNTGDGGSGRKVTTSKAQASNKDKKNLKDIEAQCEKRLAELVLAEKKGSKMNKLRFR